MIIDEKSKSEKFIDNFERIFSSHLDDNKEDLDEALTKGGIKSFRLFSNKQNTLIQKINDNVDFFINDYNKYFFENFYSKAFDDVEKLIDENYEKKSTILNTYSEQTEDMENLLNSGINKTQYLILFI